MIVSVSNWKDDIAVTFDFSNSIKIYQLFGNQWELIKEERFNSKESETVVESLKRHDVKILLCGAISKKMLEILEKNSIKVIPFLRGNIDDVLRLFEHSNLDRSSCYLPGFKKVRGYGRRRRFRGSKNNFK
jgi:predicted Fe-Mo cluster-binding NifX family protein